MSDPQVDEGVLAVYDGFGSTSTRNVLDVVTLVEVSV